MESVFFYVDITFCSFSEIPVLYSSSV